MKFKDASLISQCPKCEAKGFTPRFAEVIDIPMQPVDMGRGKQRQQGQPSVTSERLTWICDRCGYRFTSECADKK